MPVTVKARPGEDVISLMKRFKKKVDDEGIIKEYKENQFFTKPSTKRRLVKKEAERKRKIKQILKRRASLRKRSSSGARVTQKPRG